MPITPSENDFTALIDNYPTYFKNKNILLYIVGVYLIKLSRIKQFIKQLSLENYFMGSSSDHFNIKNIFVYIFLSLSDFWETFGLTIMEAMMCVIF